MKFKLNKIIPSFYIYLLLMSPISLAMDAICDNIDPYDFLKDHQMMVDNFLTELEHPQLKTIVYNEVLPLLGKRLLLKDQNTLWPSVLESNSGITFFNKSAEYQGLRIETRKGIQFPQVERHDGVSTLVIPPHTQTLGTDAKILIQNWSIGSNVHPFYAPVDIQQQRKIFDEPKLYLKDTQKEAMQALQIVQQQGIRKFLMIAPTGLGKTDILTAGLQFRIFQEKSKEFSVNKKLHIVTADKSGLVSQLKQDVVQLLENNMDISKVTIIHWGKGSKPKVDANAKYIQIPNFNKAQSLTDVQEIVDAAPGPVILMTTQRSLEIAIEQKTIVSDPYEILRGMTSSLIIDEAHHSGARKFLPVIEELIDHEASDTYLLGVSATPMHRSQGILEIFENNFWAYIDTHKTFLNKDKLIDFTAIYKQLSIAIKRGELTPFQFHPLNLGISEKNIFVKEGADQSGDSKGRFIIDPEKYDMVIEKLDPFIQNSKTGFFSASTIMEAERITIKLNSHYGDTKKFRFIHSEMSSDDVDAIMHAMKAKEIQYLVTVNKLDEGINIPHMDLYVDFSRTVPVRQLLQRIGRVLRIYPGKLKSHVVTFQDFSEYDLIEQLDFYQYYIDGKFSALSSVTTHIGGNAKLAHSVSKQDIEDQWYRSELQLMRTVVDNLNIKLKEKYQDLANEYFEYVEAHQTYAPSQRNNSSLYGKLNYLAKSNGDDFKVFLTFFKQHPKIENGLTAWFENLDKVKKYAKLADDFSAIFPFRLPHQWPKHTAADVFQAKEHSLSVHMGKLIKRSLPLFDKVCDAMKHVGMKRNFKLFKDLEEKYPSNGKRFANILLELEKFVDDFSFYPVHKNTRNREGQTSHKVTRFIESYGNDVFEDLINGFAKDSLVYAKAHPEMADDIRSKSINGLKHAKTTENHLDTIANFNDTIPQHVNDGDIASVEFKASIEQMSYLVERLPQDEILALLDDELAQNIIILWSQFGKKAANLLIDFEVFLNKGLALPNVVDNTTLEGKMLARILRVVTRSEDTKFMLEWNKALSENAQDEYQRVLMARENKKQRLGTTPLSRMVMSQKKMSRNVKRKDFTADHFKRYADERAFKKIFKLTKKPVLKDYSTTIADALEKVARNVEVKAKEALLRNFLAPDRFLNLLMLKESVYRDLWKNDVYKDFKANIISEVNDIVQVEGDNLLESSTDFKMDANKKNLFIILKVFLLRNDPILNQLNPLIWKIFKIKETDLIFRLSYYFHRHHKLPALSNSLRSELNTMLKSKSSNDLLKQASPDVRKHIKIIQDPMFFKIEAMIDDLGVEGFWDTITVESSASFNIYKWISHASKQHRKYLPVSVLESLEEWRELKK